MPTRLNWLKLLWGVALFFAACSALLWLSSTDLLGLDLPHVLHGTWEELWWVSAGVTMIGCCALFPLLGLLYLVRWAQR